MTTTPDPDELRARLDAADLIQTPEFAAVLGITPAALRKRNERRRKGGGGDLLPTPVFEAPAAGPFWTRAQAEEAKKHIPAEVPTGRPKGVKETKPRARAGAEDDDSAS